VTSTDIETRNSQGLTPRVSQASRVGQATAVEQSRAVAQVEAMVIVAMRNPRLVDSAIAAMRETCKQERLAQKAFFRFPRGGQTVSGPSIHLARELARVWGNIEYGIAELRRDDDAGQSEMIAFAWDLQTNTRNSSTFINPHLRDRSDGQVRLTDTRDIYESNANAGARRVREAIFAVLPTWFVEEAEDLCNKTLMDGGGKPLAQRVADAIAAYAAQGITQGQIEAKLGRPSDKWIEQDIAQLQVIYRSLQRGEISKDEEFPDDRVTAADITGAPKKAPASEGAGAGETPGSSDAPPADVADPATPVSPPAPAPSPPKPTKVTLGKLLARFPFQDGDVTALLGWKAGKETLAELSTGQVETITAYLDSALAGADHDPNAAASKIWQEYGEAHPESGQ
jgi:hypothetical protein